MPSCLLARELTVGACTRERYNVFYQVGPRTNYTLNPEPLPIHLATFGLGIPPPSSSSTVCKVWLYIDICTQMLIETLLRPVRGLGQELKFRVHFKACGRKDPITIMVAQKHLSSSNGKNRNNSNNPCRFHHYSPYNPRTTLNLK